MNAKCLCAAVVFGWIQILNAGNLNYNEQVRGLRPLTNHVTVARQVVDLCGEGWRVCKVAHATNLVEALGSAPKWQEVAVPCILGVGKKSSLLWTRKFDVPTDIFSKCLRLHFELAADQMDVYVNGQYVGGGAKFGMPLDIDITSAVHSGPDNVLHVLQNNDEDRRHKQSSLRALSWQYAPYQGISRPVHIEIMEKLHVVRVRATTEILPEPTLHASVYLSDGTERKFTRAYPQAKPWSPAEPNLVFVTTRELGLDILDDYRFRVGFRTLDYNCEKWKLNGRPFLNRRFTTTLPNPDESVRRAALRRLRTRGFSGLRVFLPCDLERIAALCDEEGMFISTSTATGKDSGGKTDAFWEVNYPSHLRDVIECLGNSPSVLCWGLGNEFGPPYAVTTNGVARQQQMGALAATLDPTRPWCYYGESEVALPVGARGPCPIRSLHYPIPVAANRIDMPRDSMWLTTGKWGWQGAWHRDKPLVISEDLYHGLNDSFRAMEKFAGDALFTSEGYHKTWFDIIRLMAAGHYYGGLSGWEPWQTYALSEVNPLFERGSPFPDILISLADFNRNLFSGARTVRTIRVFNESFQRLRGVLRVLAGERQIYSEEIDLLSGGMLERKVEFLVPDMNFSLVAQVEASGRMLAAEGFAHLVFDKIKMPRPPKGVRVVSGRLTKEQGHDLSRFVEEGGKVVYIDADPAGWTPLELSTNSLARYNFRRDASGMDGVDERSLAGLADASYPYRKPQKDAAIWFDCGMKDGQRYASILRLDCGAGAWYLCQLPLFRCMESEPAFGSVLVALYREADKPIPAYRRGVSVFPVDSETAKVFARCGINMASQFNPGNLLVLDMAQPLSTNLQSLLDKCLAQGGNVLALEMSERTVPPGWPIFIRARTNEVFGLKRGARIPGPFAPFVRVSNPGEGILRGVANDDIFLTKSGDLWSLMSTLGGTKSGHGIKEFALAGEIVGKPSAKHFITYTEPAGLVSFAYGRGTVWASSLRLNDYAMTQGERVEYVLRRMLNNLGVATIGRESQSDTTHWCIPIGRIANAGWWDRDGHAWSGDGDDMRYFPVNQCGWSVTARNFCPIEPFPIAETAYGGVRFRLLDPSKAAGGRTVCRLDPGARIRFKVPERQPKRLWFLGAAAETGVGRDVDRKGLEVGLCYLVGQNKRKTYANFCRAGKCFGGYKTPEAVTSGKIAWTGPAGRSEKAAIYMWSVEAPVAEQTAPFENILLANHLPYAIMICAITAEDW